jgi:hypothetical protein
MPYGRNAIDTLQKGTYGNTGEKLDWSYYDREVLASTVLTTRLFTVPLGQSSKTLTDTNLTSAGSIPQGQLLNIKAVKVAYVTNAARATANVQMIYDVFKNTAVEIIIPNKGPMGQWCLWELLGSATLIALTPTAAGDNIPLIQPRYHGIYPLSTPLTLAALTPFYVQLTHTTASNAALDNDRIYVSLAGTLVRGI